MTNAGITEELEALRAEVDRLTRDREEEAEQQEGAVDAASPVTQQRSVDVSEPDEGSEDDLSHQIQELVDALEEEIKGTNPVTMLVVFAFGILIGRFLPR